MARREHRPAATHHQVLAPLQEYCRSCGQRLWVAYHTTRTIMRLDGLNQLTLIVRRCRHPQCERYHVACRPEEEGAGK